MRNGKFIKVIQFKQMFVTAVCVLFLLKLKWPKSKNFFARTNNNKKNKPKHKMYIEHTDGRHFQPHSLKVLIGRGHEYKANS